MPLWDASDYPWKDDISRAVHLCENILAKLPEAVRPTAQAYFSYLNPDRAQLEWHLPIWLGETFGVAKETVDIVTETNVLGMIYIRILDDAMDCDSRLADRTHALALAPLLYTHCLERYATIFHPESNFWNLLHKYLQEWTKAITLEKKGYSILTSNNRAEEIIRLTSGKGAPEKICCAAMALLGECESNLPLLEKAVDLKSAISQLIDDFKDWREDLGNQRDNIFLTVALGSDPGSLPLHFHRSEDEILEQMSSSENILELFELLVQCAELFWVTVEPLGSPPMTKLGHDGVATCRNYLTYYQEQREQSILKKLTQLIS